MDSQSNFLSRIGQMFWEFLGYVTSAVQRYLTPAPPNSGNDGTNISPEARVCEEKNSDKEDEDNYLREENKGESKCCTHVDNADNRVVNLMRREIFVSNQMESMSEQCMPVYVTSTEKEQVNQHPEKAVLEEADDAQDKGDITQDIIKLGVEVEDIYIFANEQENKKQDDKTTEDESHKSVYQKTEKKIELVVETDVRLPGDESKCGIKKERKNARQYEDLMQSNEVSILRGHTEEHDVTEKVIGDSGVKDVLMTCEDMMRDSNGKTEPVVGETPFEEDKVLLSDIIDTREIEPGETADGVEVGRAGQGSYEENERSTEETVGIESITKKSMGVLGKGSKGEEFRGEWQGVQSLETKKKSYKKHLAGEDEKDISYLNELGREDRLEEKDGEECARIQPVQKEKIDNRRNAEKQEISYEEKQEVKIEGESGSGMYGGFETAIKKVDVSMENRESNKVGQEEEKREAEQNEAAERGGRVRVMETEIKYETIMAGEGKDERTKTQMAGQDEVQRVEESAEVDEDETQRNAKGKDEEILPGSVLTLTMGQYERTEQRVEEEGDVNKLREELGEEDKSQGSMTGGRDESNVIEESGKDGERERCLFELEKEGSDVYEGMRDTEILHEERWREESKMNEEVSVSWVNVRESVAANKKVAKENKVITGTEWKDDIKHEGEVFKEKEREERSPKEEPTEVEVNMEDGELDKVQEEEENRGAEVNENIEIEVQEREDESVEQEEDMDKLRDELDEEDKSQGSVTEDRDESNVIEESGKVGERERCLFELEKEGSDIYEGMRDTEILHEERWREESKMNEEVLVSWVDVGHFVEAKKEAAKENKEIIRTEWKKDINNEREVYKEKKREERCSNVESAGAEVSMKDGKSDQLREKEENRGVEQNEIIEIKMQEREEERVEEEGDVDKLRDELDEENKSQGSGTENRDESDVAASGVDVGESVEANKKVTEENKEISGTEFKDDINHEGEDYNEKERKASPSKEEPAGAEVHMKDEKSDKVREGKENRGAEKNEMGVVEVQEKLLLMEPEKRDETIMAEGEEEMRKTQVTGQDEVQRVEESAEVEQNAKQVCEKSKDEVILPEGVFTLNMGQFETEKEMVEKEGDVEKLRDELDQENENQGSVREDRDESGVTEDSQEDGEWERCLFELEKEGSDIYEGMRDTEILHEERRREESKMNEEVSVSWVNVRESVAANKKVAKENKVITGTEWKDDIKHEGEVFKEKEKEERSPKEEPTEVEVNMEDGELDKVQEEEENRGAELNENIEIEVQEREDESVEQEEDMDKLRDELDEEEKSQGSVTEDRDESNMNPIIEESGKDGERERCLFELEKDGSDIYEGMRDTEILHEERWREESKMNEEVAASWVDVGHFVEAKKEAAKENKEIIKTERKEDINYEREVYKEQKREERCSNVESAGAEVSMKDGKSDQLREEEENRGVEQNEIIEIKMQEREEERVEEEGDVDKLRDELDEENKSQGSGTENRDESDVAASGVDVGESVEATKKVTEENKEISGTEFKDDINHEGEEYNEKERKKRSSKEEPAGAEIHMKDGKSDKVREGKENRGAEKNEMGVVEVQEKLLLMEPEIRDKTIMAGEGEEEMRKTKVAGQDEVQREEKSAEVEENAKQVCKKSNDEVILPEGVFTLNMGQFETEKKRVEEEGDVDKMRDELDEENKNQGSVTEDRDESGVTEDSQEDGERERFLFELQKEENNDSEGMKDPAILHEERWREESEIIEQVSVSWIDFGESETCEVNVQHLREEKNLKISVTELRDDRKHRENVYEVKEQEILDISTEEQLYGNINIFHEPLDMSKENETKSDSPQTEEPQIHEDDIFGRNSHVIDLFKVAEEQETKKEQCDNDCLEKQPTILIVGETKGEGHASDENVDIKTMKEGDGIDLNVAPATKSELIKGFSANVVTEGITLRDGWAIEKTEETINNDGDTPYAVDRGEIRGAESGRDINECTMSTTEGQRPQIQLKIEKGVKLEDEIFTKANEIQSKFSDAKLDKTGEHGKLLAETTGQSRTRIVNEETDGNEGRKQITKDGAGKNRIRKRTHENEEEEFHVQLDSPSLDFTAQKSRIALKNRHIRAPKDPRILLQIPSLSPSSAPPTLDEEAATKPAGIKVGGVEMMRFKLPGIGAGFPVLKKTERRVEERGEEGTGQMTMKAPTPNLGPEDRELAATKKLPAGSVGVKLPGFGPGMTTLRKTDKRVRLIEKTTDDATVSPGKCDTSSGGGAERNREESKEKAVKSVGPSAIKLPSFGAGFPGLRKTERGSKMRGEEGKTSEAEWTETENNQPGSDSPMLVSELKKRFMKTERK